MQNSLKAFWWLWLPVIFLVLQAAIELLLDHQVLSTLHSENGPHETLQVIVIFSAFVVAVRSLFEMDIRQSPWLAVWVGLAGVCCFYVAGEEISWGQHLLEWNTPEFWLEKNDQGETNLHNTSSWLDQKPRLVLLLGVIVGGLLVPAVQNLKPVLLPKRFSVIYPPAALSLVAFLAVGVKTAEKLGEAFGMAVFERASEVEELYLYYFVFLYLIELRTRIAKEHPEA